MQFGDVLKFDLLWVECYFDQPVLNVEAFLSRSLHMFKFGSFPSDAFPDAT